ncbi:MAG: aminoglycoside phosphotransferase family protein [Nitrospira sp.]|nr:MAG: aminoglycoside phosphotransferase family protein [Nitrospira sp.]
MRSDPEFPHLSTALSPLLMQELLQTTLVGQLDDQRHGLVVGSCVIGETRYKPGKSCVLSYHLQLHDVSTGSHHEQVVSARLCRPDEGMAEFDRAKSIQLFRVPRLQSLAYLPETEMVVWSFPNDRKLTHLPQLLNLEFLAAHLSSKLALIGLDGSNEIETITTEVLHYLPERSCMIRYRLTAKRRSTGESCALTLYGKIYRDDIGVEVHSIMYQLAEQMPGSAVPLGYDPELRTLWQSHVPGEPFLWESLESSDALDVVRRIARCVAEFHCCTVRTPSRFDLPDIDESLLDTIKAAEHAYPDLAGRITSLVNALLAQRRSMCWSGALTTPIHRDLKMRNFLIGGEKVALIDMDSVCLGDPMTDIGSLIANFHLNGIRAGADIGSIRKIVDVFCSAYAEAVPWAVSRPRMNWFTATAFIHEITRRSIRQLDNERMQYINQYLDLSELYSSM